MRTICKRMTSRTSGQPPGGWRGSAGAVVRGFGRNTFVGRGFAARSAPRGSEPRHPPSRLSGGMEVPHPEWKGVLRTADSPFLWHQRPMMSLRMQGAAAPRTPRFQIRARLDRCCQPKLLTFSCGRGHPGASRGRCAAAKSQRGLTRRQRLGPSRGLGRTFVSDQRETLHSISATMMMSPMLGAAASRTPRFGTCDQPSTALVGASTIIVDASMVVVGPSTALVGPSTVVVDASTVVVGPPTTPVGASTIVVEPSTTLVGPSTIVVDASRTSVERAFFAFVASAFKSASSVAEPLAGKRGLPKPFLA